MANARSLPLCLLIYHRETLTCSPFLVSTFCLLEPVSIGALQVEHKRKKPRQMARFECYVLTRSDNS